MDRPQLAYPFPWRRHVGGFHFEATVLRQVFLWTLHSLPWGVHVGAELLDHSEGECLTL